jgi:bacterioferritin-associated ferredoxin
MFMQGLACTGASAHVMHEVQELMGPGGSCDAYRFLLLAKVPVLKQLLHNIHRMRHTIHQLKVSTFVSDQCGHCSTQQVMRKAGWDLLAVKHWAPHLDQDHVGSCCCCLPDDLFCFILEEDRRHQVTANHM